MSLIVLAGLGQSPGVTTTAVGLAMNWPRPIILVEADSSKPSAVLPGFLQGDQPASTGLNTLAEITARGSTLSTSTMWPTLIRLDEDTPENPGRFLLHGFSRPNVAQAATVVWPALTSVLLEVHEAGIDVLVDYGRWSGLDNRATLLRQADYVAWAISATLPGVAAAQGSLGDVTDFRAAHGRAEHQGLLVFEPQAGGYGNREISRFLGVEVAGKIPHDPKSASYYFSGYQAMSRPGGRRHFDRALSALATALQENAQRSIELLHSEVN